MKRRLILEATDLDKAYFSMLREALFSRGSAKPEQQKVSKEDRRRESRIKKALDAISEPIGTEVKVPDLRPRTLTGGTIELDQPDFKHLQDAVSETQWLAHVSDLVCDLEDRLETAEKVE